MTADVEVVSTPVIISVIIPTQPQDLCTMLMHNILPNATIRMQGELLGCGKWCFLLNMPNYGCIPILHPSIPHEGCPNMKAPPNAAHKGGLLFPLFWRMHSYYLLRRSQRPSPSKDAAPELGHSRCEYHPAHTDHVAVHLPVCHVGMLINHVAAHLSSFSCD